MSESETLKIMLVDDRPENLESLKKLLERPDLEILTAGSGNEALTMMLDHDLALVLLDVQMPDMDGFEVAELMRRNIRTRQIPIIFVTAINKERKHLFSGYEAGAVDYIFKPVDTFIIRSKVNVFLEIKRNNLAREKLVAELNQANNRLQEISQRKSDFLSAASHELRTPLTVIKEYTSLVLEEIVGPLNDEQKGCLSSSLRNCNRLANLVNDLLDLDSIESGHSHLKRECIDLSEIFENVKNDFAEKCNNAGQILRFNLKDDVPEVLGDAGMITQVLVNLVGNASKFTPGGGKISVKASFKNDSVLIEVQDNGPGISKTNQEQVFERFTQLNRRDGPGSQGTGLGLPISHKIIDMHNGELGLDSEEGVGSSFHFQLPVYNVKRHVETFVSDGITREGSLAQQWTFVFLKSEENGPDLPVGLTRDVEKLFRKGEDRFTFVKIEGKVWCLVLLRTDSQGTASFLARLEDRFTNQDSGNTGLLYSVQSLDNPNDFPFPEFPKLKFQSLGLPTSNLRSES